MIPTPEHLDGYLMLIQLNMPSQPPIHIFNVHMSPSRDQASDALRAHILHYVTKAVNEISTGSHQDPVKVIGGDMNTRWHCTDRNPHIYQKRQTRLYKQWAAQTGITLVDNFAGRRSTRYVRPRSYETKRRMQRNAHTGGSLHTQFTSRLDD